MLSLEYLDLISQIGWKLFEKVSNFQARFWLNTPVYWNSETKHAYIRPIQKCIPLLLWSLFQIPTYSFSFLILYWQSDPKYADVRFEFPGTALMAFGSVMNCFITWGSLSIFHKRKEWALCLNSIGEKQYHGSKNKRRGLERKKAQPVSSVKIFRDWTVIDVIVEGIFINFLFLGSAGFIFPFVVDGDPIHYIFIDFPEKSTGWCIIKYGVRPVWWGVWAFYCTWTFYNVTGYIFFAILHGCMIVPRVPSLSHRQPLTVINHSLANFYKPFSQRLAIQIMKGAYKEYRQFQVFIRPANDAMYVVIPDGLSGIGAVSVIGGFCTIKGYSIFPLNVYLIFPSVFCMTSLLIFVLVPIACNVFESALEYKKYWLSKFTKKEVRKRLIACRPMGVAAGPFGYIQKSLPMSMMNSICDSVCSLTMSVSI